MRRAWLLLFVLIAGCASGRDSYTERMAAEHAGDEPVATELAREEPSAPVETREVDYATLNDQVVKGYLALPSESAGNPPGVIVIQEWWGLNDNIRAMARKLAGEGYAALAVDLYEGRLATTRDEARALMTSATENAERLEDNLRQAWSFLKTEQQASRIGVIGWCFGGGWSLRTALMLPDGIDAAVIYYGRLITERERLETLDVPLLGLFGGEDRGIPVETVRQFERTLNELGKRAQIEIYDGAGHAFANPSGTRYDDAAARDAWQKTLAFLAQHLEG